MDATTSSSSSTTAITTTSTTTSTTTTTLPLSTTENEISTIRSRNIMIPIGTNEFVLLTSSSLFSQETQQQEDEKSLEENHLNRNGMTDENFSHVLDILRTEITPLRLWLDIALLCAEHGQWDRFEEILT